MLDQQYSSIFPLNVQCHRSGSSLPRCVLGFWLTGHVNISRTFASHQSAGSALRGDVAITYRTLNKNFPSSPSDSLRSTPGITSPTEPSEAFLSSRATAMIALNSVAPYLCAFCMSIFQKSFKGLASADVPQRQAQNCLAFAMYFSSPGGGNLTRFR